MESTTEQQEKADKYLKHRVILEVADHCRYNETQAHGLSTGLGEKMNELMVKIGKDFIRKSPEYVRGAESRVVNAFELLDKEVYM